MSRTVTALFDSRSDAEAAKARLVASDIDAAHIHITDQGSAGATTGSGSGHGFWQSLKDLFVSDEDRHAYGEGIRRGGYLLSAEVDERQADAAVRILDEGGSVDLDQRTADWRGSGWTGRFADDHARGQGTEEVIPVVEERLRVGKREVERGGARVRSYIREVPVNEQVTLRDEHVEVERRPVDRALGVGDLDGDLLRERTVEMTETAEEAVVAKEARVVEEVVVRKTADTHTENVHDTVRRTEVEVDHDPVQKFAGVGGSGATGPGATSGATGVPNASAASLGSASTAMPGDSVENARLDRDRVATGIDGTPPLDDGFGTTPRR
ncbi:MAG: YsnF/AvaK domain-containing protein [Sphingomonadaceae bacterium]|nr:YsnF/AvaK domain-containing protein [Sphingomonadaceae bacterium]